MRIKFVLSLLFTSIIVGLNAQTWFVSPSGSDFNSGASPSNAFASINKAIQSATCGDSIYILDGEYHEKLIAYHLCPENNRITIQGDTSHRPLIIGDSTAANKYAIGAYGSGFRFNHLELTSPYPNICAQSNQIIVGNGDHFDFIDCIVRNAGYDGIKTYGNCATNEFPEYWNIINCQIFDNGLSCPSNGDGIDLTRCQNCTVRNTVIKNNAGHQIQIKLEARNITIEHCQIIGTDLLLIGKPGTTPQCDTSALNADSVYIRNNIFWALNDQGQFSLKLADVSNLYIENNTFIKDSIPDYNSGFICFGECAGSWEYYPKPPVSIQNNIFYNHSNTPFYYPPETLALYDPQNLMPTYQVEYNLFYDSNGEFTTPPDGSPNSLVANPLFCNYPTQFQLSQNSPCINAGNPSLPPDPDGTISDIGALYFVSPCTSNSIIHLDSDNYILYPNPMKHSAILQLKQKNITNSVLIIYSSLGQEVLRKPINSSEIIRIERGNLKSGWYHFRLYQNRTVLASGTIAIL